jgi:plasmid stability protein
MPSLQIRDLPDDVYHALAFRAQQEHRRLAQQAVAELRRIPTVDRMTQRAPEAIELPDHQDIARAQIRQQGLEHRPLGLRH